ncbi:MAG: hypothetical protein ACRDLT_02745 [Solirubrobacteraceae bacterium]
MEGGRSKRTCVAALAGAICFLFAASGARAGVAKIRVGSTLAGTVLTGGGGYVLMMFPREARSLARCIRTTPCMSDWPPLTTTGRPQAGPGVDPKLLGTIPYRGKLRAVTYAGWPLHTYKFAYSAQSSVMNIGIKQFGGNWYALAPSGAVVK